MVGQIFVLNTNDIFFEAHALSTNSFFYVHEIKIIKKFKNLFLYLRTIPNVPNSHHTSSKKPFQTWRDSGTIQK